MHQFMRHTQVHSQNLLPQVDVCAFVSKLLPYGQGAFIHETSVPARGYGYAGRKDAGPIGPRVASRPVTETQTLETESLDGTNSAHAGQSWLAVSSADQTDLLGRVELRHEVLGQFSGPVPCCMDTVRNREGIRCF